MNASELCLLLLLITLTHAGLQFTTTLGWIQKQIVVRDGCIHCVVTQVFTKNPALN